MAARGSRGGGGGREAETVKVVVRCRPMSSQEEIDGRVRVVEMDSGRGSVILMKPGMDETQSKTFAFDAVYDWNSTQRLIYEETARPIVQAAMDGFNGTIFAYGQTGTGKTFTMEGVYENRELRGIIPNAFENIFDDISEATNANFLVRASYLEIYNEEVRDLLSKTYMTPLKLKEHPETGVYVKGLSAFVVKSVDEIDQVMQAGKKNRTVGATKMNMESSRSHSIFTITIECSEMGADGSDHIRVGKLNLVDLAGSERQSKTGAENERLTEAININKSLSALGNVIKALVDAKSKHVPYRDSKLTRLLQDSLGGNSKTVMVANMGPADYNYEESLSTLRYANRAKNIKNKPKINEDPKDAMLRQFQEEIEKLKAQLAAAGMSDDMDPAEAQAFLAAGGTLPRAMSNAAMNEIQAAIEKERAEMHARKGMAAEEKEKLASELEERERELEEERQKRAAMAAKLAAMEEKVLVGGENLIDLVRKQETEVETRKAELEQQRREEERLKQELLDQQEAMELKKNEFSNLQEEVDIKTRKLKKLWTKLQAAKNEISDLEEEHARDKYDLAETIRANTKDLLLCHTIINNFIPPTEKEKIQSRAIWDDETEDYTLDNAPLQFTSEQLQRPVARNGFRRPTCEYARMAISMGPKYFPRFKCENILQLGLDGNERYTQDYTGPSVDPRLKAALDSAIDAEADMMLVASENLPDVYQSYDDNGAGGAGAAADNNSGGGGGGRRPKSKRSGRSGGRRAGSARAEFADESLYPRAK